MSVESHRLDDSRHVSGCDVCAAASTTLIGRHLDDAEVEALALREGSVDAEAEEHITVCASCRAEVEDLARFAQTFEKPPSVPVSSRVAELLQMPQEERRKAAVSTTWSLEELQEMTAAALASEKAGPASDYAIAVLLSLMCDHAEDDAPRAIVTALKWQSLYRIVFAAARCGKLSEADAALKRAEELAHELPNADHYLARLDIGQLFTHTEVGARDVCGASSDCLDRAAEIALSFGDTRLYLLMAHYRGGYYYNNGRYDLAAEAFVPAAPTVMKSRIGRTAGVVRQLLERWRTERYKSPARALELTALAVEIANEISPEEYSSDFVNSLRADAWRDHAFGLQLLGRFPEAIAAINEAERLLLETAIPDYGLARIKLVRANILAWDKRPEAITLADAAAKTFLDFGDRVKYAAARITQAAALYEYGAIREALEIWESIKNDEGLDELNRILVNYNLGLAYREVGDTARSAEHITLATAEYELLGMTAEATRARWALATTLVSAGKFTPAIALFERAWKEFEALDMEADAALVALDLAETLLVVGEAGRVPHICRILVDRFTRAGMTSRAITALSYLREVVASGKAQPLVIRQVRELLRELPSQGRPTVPLPLHEPER